MLLLTLAAVTHLTLISGAVVWTEAEGEVVAIDNATSEYLTLNDTAAVLWRRLAAGTDEAAMVAELLREYEPIDEEQARADVRAFVDALRARGFVAPAV